MGVVLKWGKSPTFLLWEESHRRRRSCRPIECCLFTRGHRAPSRRDDKGCVFLPFGIFLAFPTGAGEQGTFSHFHNAMCG